MTQILFKGEQDLLKGLRKEQAFSAEDYLLKEKTGSLTLSKNKDFFYISKVAKDEVEKQIELKIKNNSKEDYVEIYHRALIGDPASIKMIKGMIRDFINFNSYTEIQFPNYYSNLENAIFHQEFGLGPLSTWWEKIQSPAAKVIGKDIWYMQNGEYVRQSFSFKNLDEVYAICQRLKHLDKKNKLDPQQHTELETISLDGIRISIMIPERSYEPIITLRRQVVSIHSFEEQSKLHTIPSESIGLFKFLSKLSLNSIVAGPPAVGKSTFLMTMLAETQHLHTAFVESNYEFYIREIFPNTPFIHVRGEGADLEKKVFPALLRHDIEQIIVQEVRKAETEIYGSAGERGIKKLMGTFHNLDPVNIPGTLARLNIQHHSGTGLSYRDEYIRFAENLHFSITMDEVDKTKKRITGVQFYDVNPHNLQVSIYKIIHYDYEKDTWEYNNDIPQRIERIMKIRDLNSYNEFQSLLSNLSTKYPMRKSEQMAVGLQGSAL